jgi:GntR family transcriptional regulator/MocR family aminotransferase
MRALYAERRRDLASAVHTAFGERATVEPAAGGLHLLARFPGAADDSLLAKRAANAGLATTALSSLTIAHDAGQGLMLSFTNAVPAEALIARLAAAIRF